MPVAAKSLANLKSPWRSDTAPRDGGAWPGWRRALREVVGDGRELFEALAALARGQAIALRAPEGEPMRNEDGRPIVLVPNGAIMLGAIRELLDRSFGRPVQAIADVTPAPEPTAAEIRLSPEDQKAVMAIAHRALLGRSDPEPNTSSKATAATDR